VAGGNYTLGNTIADVNSKIYQIAFNTFDGNVTPAINGTGGTNTFEAILKSALSNMQKFLYNGE
jgi:hypothetical protein